jgi:hypothetical protein
MYNDDRAYIIANCVFVGLVEAVGIAFAVACKLPWWAYALIIIGLLIMATAYKSIAEMLLCPYALGIIGFLIYDAVSSDITIPTAWIVLTIIWDVLFISYMVFFSNLRETIDERRLGMWK